MDIAVIGPPGAGKGTHARKIVAKFGLCYVSTGELLRENLRQQTNLGLMTQKYMDHGEMVPDDGSTTLSLSAARQASSKARGSSRTRWSPTISS